MLKVTPVLEKDGERLCPGTTVVRQEMKQRKTGRWILWGNDGIFKDMEFMDRG